MMYYEDNKYRIQADMALRIGKIAVQYSQVSRPHEDYSITLHLCLLQNLLTYCTTLFDAMDRNGSVDLGLHTPLLKKTDWGLHQVDVLKDSFEGELTAAVFITHLRNAMCHPTGPNIKAKFPSTGYYGIPDDEKLPIAKQKVIAIGFCDSPDTDKNTPITWKLDSGENAQKYLKAKQDKHHIPMGVKIATTRDNRLGMFYFGEPYAREFSAILTNEQLRDLLLNLSNLLGQPAREFWNGKDIIYLLDPAA